MAGGLAGGLAGISACNGFVLFFLFESSTRWARIQL